MANLAQEIAALKARVTMLENKVKNHEKRIKDLEDESLIVELVLDTNDQMSMMD